MSFLFPQLRTTSLQLKAEYLVDRHPDLNFKNANKSYLKNSLLETSKPENFVQKVSPLNVY